MCVVTPSCPSLAMTSCRWLGRQGCCPQPCIACASILALDPYGTTGFGELCLGQAIEVGRAVLAPLILRCVGRACRGLVAGTNVPCVASTIALAQDARGSHGSAVAHPLARAYAAVFNSSGPSGPHSVAMAWILPRRRMSCCPLVSAWSVLGARVIGRPRRSMLSRSDVTISAAAPVAAK